MFNIYFKNLDNNKIAEIKDTFIDKKSAIDFVNTIYPLIQANANIKIFHENEMVFETNKEIKK